MARGALRAQGPARATPRSENTPDLHSLFHRCSERDPDYGGHHTPWALPKPQDPANLLGHFSRIFFLPKPEVLMKKKQSAWVVLWVELCSPPKDMFQS